MKNTKLFIILLITLLTISGCAYYIVNKNRSTNSQEAITLDSKQSVSKSNQQTFTIQKEGKENKEPTITTDTQDNKFKLFKNQYLSIKILAGWTVEELKNGAVNIEKDNYILYINPNVEQVSGVKGGRLDEISYGSPSADLVTNFRPAKACSPKNQTETENFTRIDLYVDNDSDEIFCKKPTDNKRHWYFSYYVDGDGYFNYVEDDDFHPYAITVSFKTDSINNLPVVDNTELNQILKEMDFMVDSVQIFSNNN